MRPSRTLSFVMRQIVIVVGAIVGYFGVRGLTEGNVATAERNAGWVLDVERWLGIAFERGLQESILASELVVNLANWVYIWMHWPVLVATLIWLIVVDREEYVELRNAMIISGVIGLFIFATFPVAPPRLLGLDYVDTVTERSHAYRVLQPPSFTNAYAAAPVCSPTRGSIMTGKCPARTHLTVNIPTGRNLDRPTVTPEFAESLPLDEVTVAEALKTAGYTTGHFGKWHLNRDKDYAPDRPGDPASQGFDVVLTTHKLDEGPPSPYENDWQHVRQITEAAIAFIEENRDRPFFAYVSHNSIHRPEKEKDTLIAKYRAKPGADNEVEYGHNNPVQAAMLEVLDASVGRILDRLSELGLEKNTLIVFFSDNGHLGPKDGFPLRGSKADLYEGGIRLPLIVRQPGTVPPGTTRDSLVISNDFFPTFCRLAGVTSSPPGIDGMDIADLFRGSETGPARDTLFFHFPHYHALGVGPQSALREGNLKLIENTEARLLGLPDAFELYDLASDPAERHNLAGEQPGTGEQGCVVEVGHERHGDVGEWGLGMGYSWVCLGGKGEAEKPGE